ncbi:VanZ family protein [Truepera radiovictrix]|uniref:VanZ family protein n=1 Tax=Truepera radiovictrix (strain DSM 17093 / CIP 108686 / LMG 22925 / RQ-24) TaxID=649638 RepID=D7CQ97_TRURR|nr:VanZ family protein [Truepera radiovictrix]ADI14881.1 VanZ family protein [Truepera radiovictrix DSM 17093]WMT56568.1 VanZ family protein [Truepera radiovictrix]
MNRPLWWLAALAWAGLTFWFSSSPDAQGAAGWLDLSPPRDKLFHAANFGVLGLLILFASGRPLLAVLLASLYGAVDELHQATVPGRSADVADWVADTLGAAFAVTLAVLWQRQRARDRLAR